MEIGRKWRNRALAAVSALGVISLLRLTPFWPDVKGGILCGNVPGSPDGMIAPGGKVQALQYGRSCGFAINDLWPNVSILPIGQKLANKRGNVFACGDTSFTYDDTHEFGVQWSDDRHLIIFTTPFCVEKADRRIKRFGDIEIAYKPAPIKAKKL